MYSHGTASFYRLVSLDGFKNVDMTDSARHSLGAECVEAADITQR